MTWSMATTGSAAPQNQWLNIYLCMQTAAAAAAAPSPLSLNGLHTHFSHISIYVAGSHMT